MSLLLVFAGSYMTLIRLDFTKRLVVSLLCFSSFVWRITHANLLSVFYPLASRIVGISTGTFTLISLWGYQYMAITEHSGGRGIAHGLGIERLREQVAEIKALNRRSSGIRVLTGTEVDIRADGSLDLPHEILAELDIVTAAIHSAMNQSEEKMTQRVVKAIENPDVDVIAHPTCRLIGDREPVAIDLEAVFRAAATHNKIMEINAMPKRLDLRDIHAFRARELGVKFAIGTDAHSVAHLGLMRFGIGVARRAWCEPQHVLNTLPLEELLVFLNPRR